jgi:hypothetical protein
LIALAQRLAPGACAGRDIATVFADRGQPRQRVGDSDTVDQQDALVAVTYFGDVALRHGLRLAVLRDCLDDCIGVWVAFLYPKYGFPAHAVQRFDDDVLVLVDKLFQNRRIATDPGLDAAMRKYAGVQLFIAVPQAGRPVDDQYTVFFRLLQ